MPDQPEKVTVPVRPKSREDSERVTEAAFAAARAWIDAEVAAAEIVPVADGGYQGTVDGGRLSATGDTDEAVRARLRRLLEAELEDDATGQRYEWTGLRILAFAAMRPLPRNCIKRLRDMDSLICHEIADWFEKRAARADPQETTGGERRLALAEVVAKLKTEERALDKKADEVEEGSAPNSTNSAAYLRDAALQWGEAAAAVEALSDASQKPDWKKAMWDEDMRVEVSDEEKKAAEIEGAASGECPFCQGGMDAFGGVHAKDCPLVLPTAQKPANPSGGVVVSEEEAAGGLRADLQHRLAIACEIQEAAERGSIAEAIADGKRVAFEEALTLTHAHHLDPVDAAYELHMEQCAHGGTLMRIDRLLGALREINGHIGADPGDDPTLTAIREVCEREFSRGDADEAARVAEGMPEALQAALGVGLQDSERAALRRLRAEAERAKTDAFNTQADLERGAPAEPERREAMYFRGKGEAYMQVAIRIGQALATNPSPEEAGDA